MPDKINRTVYRLWHDKSPVGRVGYIGKDKRYPKRVRLTSRLREKSVRKLHRALNKYPISVWNIEILAQGFKTDIAMAKAEKSFIKAFNSRLKGYNCTDGGEGAIGHEVSKEARKRISDGNKGKRQLRELVEIRRQSLLEHYREFPSTQERADKIRETKLKNPWRPNKTQRKKMRAKRLLWLKNNKGVECLNI